MRKVCKAGGRRGKEKLGRISILNSHRQTINNRETRSDFPWEVVTSFLLIFYLNRIVELTYIVDNIVIKVTIQKHI